MQDVLKLENLEKILFCPELVKLETHLSNVSDMLMIIKILLESRKNLCKALFLEPEKSWCRFWCRGLGINNLGPGVRAEASAGASASNKPIGSIEKSTDFVSLRGKNLRGSRKFGKCSLWL